MVDALQILERDVMGNVVMLKMLAAYPGAVRCLVAGEAVLMLQPVQVSAFDRQLYPGMETIVMLSGSDPDALAALLMAVPRGGGLVFKLNHPAQRAAVQSVFTLRRATAFHSFTTPPGIRQSRRRLTEAMSSASAMRPPTAAIATITVSGLSAAIQAGIGGQRARCSGAYRRERGGAQRSMPRLRCQSTMDSFGNSRKCFSPRPLGTGTQLALESSMMCWRSFGAGSLVSMAEAKG